MKILMVSPADIPIPPYSGYGGVERVVFDLAMGLAGKGHKIDLIANCKSKIKHPGITLEGTEEEIKNGLKDFILCNAMEKDYDIINLHLVDFDLFNELLKKGLNKKCIVNLHYTPNKEEQEAILSNFTGIAQSKSHRDQFIDNENLHYILQGIRIDHITFYKKPLSENNTKIDIEILRSLRQESRDYLVMLSRIDKRKGQLTAIKIAKKAGMPLILAGEPYVDHSNAESSSLKYFYENIKPLIDNKTIFYFGNADETVKYKLLGNAAASVFPSGFEDERWSEPFGRVIAESLAAGTPVIGFARGAVKEQIVHGKNGFIFRSVDEAAGYVKRLDSIYREFCSMDARERLNAERFIDDMEKFFFDFINGTIICNTNGKLNA